MPEEWVSRIKNWPTPQDASPPSKEIESLKKECTYDLQTMESLAQEVRLAERTLQEEEMSDDSDEQLPILKKIFEEATSQYKMSSKKLEEAERAHASKERKEKIPAFRKRVDEMKKISHQLATCQTVIQAHETASQLKKFLSQLPLDEHLFFSSLPLRTERKQELILPRFTTLSSVIKSSIKLEDLKPLALALWFLWRHLQPDPTESIFEEDEAKVQQSQQLSAATQKKKKLENPCAPSKEILECARMLNIDMTDYLS